MIQSLIASAQVIWPLPLSFWLKSIPLLYIYSQISEIYQAWLLHPYLSHMFRIIPQWVYLAAPHREFYSVNNTHMLWCSDTLFGYIQCRNQSVYISCIHTHPPLNHSNICMNEKKYWLLLAYLLTLPCFGPISLFHKFLPLGRNIAQIIF